MAEVLAERFQTLDRLRAMSLAELEGDPRDRPVVAASVHDYFQDPENVQLLDELEGGGREPGAARAGGSHRRQACLRRQDVRPDRHASEAQSRPRPRR